MTRNELWIMAAINIPVALVAIGIFGRFSREKVRVPEPVFQKAAPSPQAMEVD